MKKHKKINLILLITAILMGLVACYFATDRYKFAVQDKRIGQYVSSVLGVKSADISKERYCWYSHQKYNKGSLGCGLLYSFTSTSKDYFSHSTDDAGRLGWKYKWDNTTSNNAYSEEKYLKSEVYGYRGLYCSFVTIEQGAEYNYQISCSGPAKAEWFPVREN